MEAGLANEAAPAPASAIVEPSLPAFLKLSREIRDLIYHAVLESADEAPISPSACGPRLEAGSDCENWIDPCQYTRPPLDFATMGACTRYLEIPLHIESRSLLFVSRQIHMEIKEAIARFETSHEVTYKLDLIIENEYVLYPTWTSLPIVSPRVDVVETQIRAMGDWTDTHGSGWYAGAGGHSHLGRSLLELLQRFLVRGPDFLSQPKEPVLKIGLLVLDIITPEEPEKMFLPVERQIGNDAIREHGLIHPESMAACLVSQIDEVMHYACDGAPEELRTRYKIMKLVDYIDRIELRVDGNERKCWVLKEYMELFALYLELFPISQAMTFAQQG